MSKCPSATLCRLGGSRPSTPCGSHPLTAAGGRVSELSRDDVLLTSGDAWALAALIALRDLSQSVQVTLLTHRSHLLELATTPPLGTVHMQRFGVVTATAAMARSDRDSLSRAGLRSS